MRRTLCALVGALTLVGIGTTSLPAQASRDRSDSGSPQVYLVVLRQAPVASYQGDLTGYQRTAPAPGQRFRDDRASVRTYRDHLLAEQTRVLAEVGSPAVLYSYTTALDGFAVMLTPAEVKTLQADRDVLLAQPDSVVKVDDTDSQPGAGTVSEPPPTRLWHRVGGPRQAGRGVVVGVIDTGVGPDNPSLAGIPTSRSALERRYPGFSGTCEPGERWTPTTCTSKVIAARYFVRGFGRADVATSDYLSPRDGSGHGTSVAAIAAGNSGVDTEIAGQSFGHISGLAPAAGLSIYKACWSAPDPASDGCDTADLLAAIDRAVRDGVDVINYSIAGPRASLGEAVDLAFLNAAAANVFVATAAGNNGPRAGSVQHAGPWVTTVGANTHAIFQGGIRLGDGRTYVGAMLSDRSVGPAPLVYAGDAPAAGVTARHAALCYPGSIDAQRADGAIVVCDRGVTSRVSKSAAVAQSGGSAMVLVNTRPEGVEADQHAVPTVHLGRSAGRAVKAYIERLGRAATGSIKADATDNPPEPVVAAFSGRGPAHVADGDLLKPDLTAPGVSVVSAVAGATEPGRLWDVVSGTSIAAPHVAGVAAVVRAAHPTWSPAMVKSAMMSTATSLEGASSPLTRGAGQLDPSAVLQPGLVYGSGLPAWTALLRGRLDPSQLNQPSISVGDLVGRESVTRTVTNVGRTDSTYTASLAGLRGVAGSITPGSLTLSPGQSRSFTITFSATRNASYDTFATGALTWADADGNRVTTPVAIRPELASVPAEVSGSGRHGSADIRALAGVTGTIRVTTSGLVDASPVPLSLHAGDFDPARPTTSAATAMATLTVPAGSPAARFQVSSSQAGDDVDLYVYRGDRLVASATDRSGNETITVRTPEPGSYRVYVNADRAAGGTADVTFTTWVLPKAHQRNLDLTPRSLGVNGGERFSVTPSWSGLDTDRRWWGFIGYAGLPDVTFLTVN